MGAKGAAMYQASIPEWAVLAFKRVLIPLLVVATFALTVFSCVRYIVNTLQVWA
jgi:hypothetical protein